MLLCVGYLQLYNIQRTGLKLNFRATETEKLPSAVYIFVLWHKCVNIYHFYHGTEQLGRPSVISTQANQDSCQYRKAVCYPGQQMQSYIYIYIYIS